MDSRLGNCMASETADPQDMVGGRDGAFASAPDPAGQTPANPSGPRRVNMRMTPNGVMASP
jgi:hypothetical protein